MIKSNFHISQMDCPSEENMIRMQLDGLEFIKKLEFDLEKRNLIVFHLEDNKEIIKRLEVLNLGVKFLNKENIDESELKVADTKNQQKLLWSVLIINFVFFIIEITSGVISKSMGLVADSLDMLADSLVYGLSLWAVGSTVIRKKKVARLSGYFQITLAVMGIIEVIRRFLGFESMPDFRLMIGISILALIANGVCLFLLLKSKSNEAHMKASMVFTSNDVIINLGVIIAGVLVIFTKSKYPDLIIGGIVFLIVVRGALRILKLGK
ncbi:cation transporter [Flammeovirga yaeyamensis]|uniref:Cation transporter n=1 Tax=Flammeovirga yaeyamensis TaxID=367791 RepID=A0AAX1N9A4_9BACT|nr:cation diffusion facilitator family transporter [Flammeovirga yaeyamensis]NMF35249.1 cation transporter [Flammeovirga yaeyamensis]QWG04110.1 cation transporter [Flammeovirga yaeyamensis]